MPGPRKSTKNSKPPSKSRALAPIQRSVFTYVPPTSRHQRLVYFERFSLTEPAVGVGTQRVIRLNSAYDVDSTIGSTATPGFSEMAAFFSAYRVWRSSVKVSVSATGGSAGTFATVGVYPNATNTYLSGAGAEVAWLTAPHSSHRMIRADGTGGVNVATVVRHFALPAVARVTRQQYATDMDYSATTVANPNRIIGAAVFCVSTGSSTTVTYNVNLWVSMDIEFFNPIQLTA